MAVIKRTVHFKFEEIGEKEGLITLVDDNGRELESTHVYFWNGTQTSVGAAVVGFIERSAYLLHGRQP